MTAPGELDELARRASDAIRHAARSLGDDAPPVAELRHRQQWRRRRRAGVAMAGVAVLVGLALTGIGQLGGERAPVIGDPEESEPDGWQTVTIGRAALSVPGDWRIRRVPDEGMPVPDHTFRSGPVAYVADGLYQPSSPPAREELSGLQPGVYALPAETGGFRADWLREEGKEATVAGRDVRWAEADAPGDPSESLRWYLFDDLDLILWVSYDPDPDLMDRVLGTVRES